MGKSGGVVAIILFLVIPNIYAIFEDQVGKFEWHKRYIGNPVFTHIHDSGRTKSVIVTTEKNIIAALNFDTLEIKWRQALQRRIVFTHVGADVVTVSNPSEPVVRSWDVKNGLLKWEWILKSETPTPNPLFFVINKKLAVVDFTPTELVTNFYALSTGTRSFNEIRTIGVYHRNRCSNKDNLILCLSEDQRLFVLEVLEDDVIVKYKDVSSEGTSMTLEPVSGPLPIAAVRLNRNVIYFRINPDISSLPISTESCAILTSYQSDRQDMIISAELKNGVLTFRRYSKEGVELGTLRRKIDYPTNYGVPVSIQASGSNQLQILLQTDDNMLIRMNLRDQVEIIEVREESLAAVVSVEIVDLPMSETDAAIEKELGNKQGSFISMFIRRILNQSVQLKNFLLSIFDIGIATNGQETNLVRDNFGLNKLIVVVTEPGNIFGIENSQGNIVWKLRVPELLPYKLNDSPSLPLFVMRTSIFSPYPAQCALLGRQKDGAGIIVAFNPITGSLVESLVLDYRVKQTCPLHLLDKDFIKGFLLLDEQNKVHVYPKSSAEVAEKVARSTFIYTANLKKNELQGFALRVNNNAIRAIPTWTMHFGTDGSDESEKILKIAGKRNDEKVHSQGRVLGDRSVLYKYSNPNLVAVLTQGYHPSHRNILNVYLVDVVSGQVLFATSHKRAREPVHVVHSENWLVYSWFSEKNRRTELATFELYEGNSQANASAFTSLDTHQPPLLTPMVERQAYILPTQVRFLRETITEKGITNKHILVGLSNGGVLELPWAYVDPRRTVTVTQEMREEGVIPYIPELPLPPEAIVNHNRSVLYATAAHTAPSSLESTCLLFVYGLDHYYTRVAPSKTFDLLKDDFDYFTIIAVLSVLALASFITKRLSARKALKQAWK